MFWHLLHGFETLLATLLHAALMLGLAPLLAGCITKLRARLLGRRGPPLTQPYCDLAKTLAKATLEPETASGLFGVWPFAAFAAIATAALLVPGFCTGMITAPESDFVVLIGLFALARAATLLAAQETGFGFGGAAAARDALFGVFAEAAMLTVLLSFFLLAGGTGIDGIARHFRAGPLQISVPLGFALAALLAVALAETGRLPADNPGGHLELAMVHEAMLLEYSGRYLALFQATAMLRLMVWFCLIAALFCPFGMGQAAAPLTWPLGLASWALKLAALAGMLALFEISTAKMRVFRVPEFLGAAILLGILAGIFLLLAARLGA